MHHKLAVAMVFLTVPAVVAASPAEENVDALLRFYDAVNQGNLESFDQFMADGFVENEELPGLPPTREGVREWFEMMHAAFPDLKFDVDFTMVDGDKVAAYLTVSGTQAEEFLGIPSQGLPFSVKTIDIVQFADGKAVAHWGVTDTGAMMQQLTGAGE